MITNIVILSVTLLTNSQSAIVGESQGKALVASQETVIQRTITLEDVVLRSAVTTNAVGFAFQRPATNQASSDTKQASLPTKSVSSPTNSPSPSINTNSPAYRRKLIQEQRMKPSTNAPPQPPQAK